MIFFSVVIIGLCAISSAQDDVTDDTPVLTVYGIHKQNEIAFLPLEIKQTIAKSEPFVFKPEYFKEAEPNYYNQSFVLVYRPTEDADHLVSFFIKEGLQSFFDYPIGPFRVQALQKYLLSEEHYGFTPRAAQIFAPEFFELPITELNTDHIAIRTDIYLYEDTPFLFVIPRSHLGLAWMIRDINFLGTFPVHFPTSPVFESDDIDKPIEN